MTEYQLQYLRYLRMTHEWPDLNHRGHEPVATVESGGLDVYGEIFKAKSVSGGFVEMANKIERQRRAVEREFARMT